MRKILLSLVALFGMGTAGFAQDTLQGVYAPPGPAWPTAPGAGKSGNASKPTLAAPNYGPVDAAPAVTIPGTGSQGTQLLTVQRLKIAK
jgi:hypothetical protein